MEKPSDESTIDPQPAAVPRPAADFDASLPLISEERTGAQMGRYKLLEKIGEGGFGVVYVAEQRTPIRRRVALKIIKLGMDTRSVVARFEAERQALAMMDHLNIAKVLDAGATETGRPYFVMELVRGVAITAYCDQNKLSPVARANLFILVCHAIQHAHQKGIIHRDIKPSNILVTLHDGVPIPKVIDFGIAKATQGDLTEKTVYTQFQQFIGTPAYISPEQAEMSGLDVDTRSDIYSLGVLLYELLTGMTPFDGKELMEAGMDEMRRTIRQTEPDRPSNRLSRMFEADCTATAKRRGMDARHLITLLRGDLDWIVMKCLEKDRTRRYETANALALDIQRHLNHEPISARPPSTVYRLQKFVRRNNLAVLAAAAFVVAILIGVGLATVGFFRASTERNRAVAALDEARHQQALADENFRAARGAVEDILRIANEKLTDEPGLEPLRMALMQAAIDRYEPFLSKPIADPTPREELARLHAEYGQLLLSKTEVFDESVMGEFEKARQIQEQLLKEHPGDRPIRMDLGWTLIMEEWRQHKAPPLPEQSGKQAVELFRSLVAEDPSDPFARDDLVWALWRYAAIKNGIAGGADPEAMALVNEAIGIAEQLAAEYPASVEFRRELQNALGMSVYIQTGTMDPRQLAQKTIPTLRRTVALSKSCEADIVADRPNSRQPQRPENAEANMVRPSRIWTQFDVGTESQHLADEYAVVGDWRDAAEVEDRSATLLKDLVEHNPTVATFDGLLNYTFDARLDAAEREKNRTQVAAWSKDSVAYWNRLVELHPDIAPLHDYAQDAEEQNVLADKWLANPTTKN